MLASFFGWTVKDMLVMTSVYTAAETLATYDPYDKSKIKHDTVAYHGFPINLYWTVSPPLKIEERTLRYVHSHIFLDK